MMDGVTGIIFENRLAKTIPLSEMPKLHGSVYALQAVQARYDEQTRILARQLADKIAEEEEWNEMDDEDQAHIRKLGKALTGLSISQLHQLLSLP